MALHLCSQRHEGVVDFDILGVPLSVDTCHLGRIPFDLERLLPDKPVVVLHNMIDQVRGLPRLEVLTCRNRLPGYIPEFTDHFISVDLPLGAGRGDRFTTTAAEVEAIRFEDTGGMIVICYDLTDRGPVRLKCVWVHKSTPLQY